MPQLPIHDGPSPKGRSKSPLLLLLAIPCLMLVHSPFSASSSTPVHDLSSHSSLAGFKAPQCPSQAKKLVPSKSIAFPEGYRDAAAQLLSEAVVRPSETLAPSLSPPPAPFSS